MAETAWITVSEAINLVAGKTEKIGGVDPQRWFDGDTETFYAFGRIPLNSFAENEAGDYYDGTVNHERARYYSGLETPAPPVIAVPSRDGSCLRILDGGHRLSAARMKGCNDILGIIRVKAKRLVDVLNYAEAQGWKPCDFAR